MSNSDRKSISIINLSPSTITSMYSYSPEPTSQQSLLHNYLNNTRYFLFRKKLGKTSKIDYQQGRLGFCPTLKCIWKNRNRETIGFRSRSSLNRLFACRPCCCCQQSWMCQLRGFSPPHSHKESSSAKKTST